MPRFDNSLLYNEALDDCFDKASSYSDHLSLLLDLVVPPYSSTLSYSLSEIVLDTLSLTHRLANTFRLKIQYRASPDIPERFLGKPTALCFLIHRLVWNAIYFRYKIRISSSFRDVSELDHRIDISATLARSDPQSRTIEFSISDTSSGIPEEHLGTVFALAKGCEGMNPELLRTEHWQVPGDLRMQNDPGLEAKPFIFSFTYIIAPSLPSPLEMRQFWSRKIMVIEEDGTHEKTQQLIQMVEDLGMQPVLTPEVTELEKGNREVLRLVTTVIAQSYQVVEQLKGMNYLQGIPVILLGIPETGVDVGYCLKHLIYPSTTWPSCKEDLAFILLPALRLNNFVYPANILMIEDNPIIQTIVVVMLERNGHQMSLANNGCLGLERYRTALMSNEPYDVILLDEHMPFMNGETTAKIIRQQEAYAGLPRTPIIGLLVSLNPQTSSYPELDICMYKPLSRATLVDSVRRVMNRKALDILGISQAIDGEGLSTAYIS